MGHSSNGALNGTCNEAQPEGETSTTEPVSTNGDVLQIDHEIWYFPPDIANDLRGIDIPEALKAETLATAWEYTRIVIPNYTNWDRYVAFMRTIIIAIIAEFRGSLVDIIAGDDILGYDLSIILQTLFEGTPGRVDMAREFRNFVLISADKSSDRRSGELFRRYVNTLSQSPRNWFRMRDCDALARFTLAAMLACNDLNEVWFTEEQFEILCEMSCTMYDAVAFYKHRSEGETNSTFAYMPDDLRKKAFKVHRDTLWALDVCWAKKRERQGVINFMRFFGGPLHMMARRYRFVEEDLTIGRAETENVVDLARQNSKLWHRLDDTKVQVKDMERYKNVIARANELLFPKLADMLEQGGDGTCGHCKYRASYGADVAYKFGGVELCSECKNKWRRYLESFPVRAAWVFPELAL